MTRPHVSPRLHLPHVGAPLRLSLVLAAVLVLGCEPLGPIPGGRLDGIVVPEPVADWSFTDGHSTVQLETRLADPYSVTVWCIARGARLYVPSRRPENKKWVQFVLDDPRVRVGVDDRLYAGRATRVVDPAEIEAVVPALVAKYDLDPPGTEDEDEVWLFRIESDSSPDS